MNHFCDGLKRAETDDDKFTLASHIISTAMDLKGTYMYWFLFFMHCLFKLLAGGCMNFQSLGFDVNAATLYNHGTLHFPISNTVG